jgi:nucleoside-diphosphate-sugar epimerase
MVHCEWDRALTSALVTGGSGYFGSLLATMLADFGWSVRVLDLVDADDRPATIEFGRADIRDFGAVRGICEGIDVVFHNVAQVPLARDQELFESVNAGGTQTLLEACEDANVSKVVVTSSSAVFGIPAHNPVLTDSPTVPVEAYGRAKLAAEFLCHAASTRGLDVTIVRPRTVLGHGRLGIFGILFDWVADGVDIFVLGDGSNVYQFVHADDLARACISAGQRADPATYNIGASEFGTMRQTLESLCLHANTNSRVRSLPKGLTARAMQLTSRLGLTPFGAYHWLMYGQSMWFDISKAVEELDWEPQWSNNDMFAQSYDWFLEHRDHLSGNNASHHRKPARQGVLQLAKLASRLAPR